MAEWEEKLLEEALKVVKHGGGKVELCVGPRGDDKTNILIIAGKTHRFIIDKK